jgi:hypothetical protein
MKSKAQMFVAAMAVGVVSSGAACSSSGELGSVKVGETGGGADDPRADGGVDGHSAGGGKDSGGDDGVVAPPVLPFQVDPPMVYVAKVKNILVGLPPTDAEVASVVADPTKLGGLIDRWMKLPEYATKMRRFFELAFQQTQITVTEFSDQTPSFLARFANAKTGPALLQNATESFARTALAIAAEGGRFEQTATTHRFMMTPALMQFYSFLDILQVDNSGKVRDLFASEYPGAKLVIEAENSTIPLSDTIDPKSPNFMHWFHPEAAAALKRTTPVSCVGLPLVFPLKADQVQQVIYGTIPNVVVAGANCPAVKGGPNATALLPSDFTTWKMVTIREPVAGSSEKRTSFVNLANFRTTSELVLTTPRVGFFTTPAFFANWATNDSNQMRGTMNQALIVATGSFIDGTDPTRPPSTPGLDAAHAAPGTACYGCHVTLDPLRSVLAATYSWNYHLQDDAKIRAQKGLFAYRGVTHAVSTVDDLAAQLASHPLFGEAWVQKLCYYANSAACAADDPEFRRVARVFEQSGHSWNALVRELLSSPLTTNAVATKSASDRGQLVGVSRRDHFCAAMNQRLGLTDLCGLDAFETKALDKKALVNIPIVASGLPSDGYGRGASIPVLPNAPTLFYRAAIENICVGVADKIVDNVAAPKGTKQWSSKMPDVAIAEFVNIVMALTSSDARAAASMAILKEHFASAVAGGATASDALKSTFTLACLSPSATAIGM